MGGERFAHLVAYLNRYRNTARNTAREQRIQFGQGNRQLSDVALNGNWRRLHSGPGRDFSTPSKKVGAALLELGAEVHDRLCNHCFTTFSVLGSRLTPEPHGKDAALVLKAMC